MGLRQYIICLQFFLPEFQSIVLVFYDCAHFHNLNACKVLPLSTTYENQALHILFKQSLLHRLQIDNVTDVEHYLLHNRKKVMTKHKTQVRLCVISSDVDNAQNMTNQSFDRNIKSLRDRERWSLFLVPFCSFNIKFYSEK